MGEERDAAYMDAAYKAWPWLDKPAAEAPWAPIWRAALEFVLPTDDVLDIGCGAGHAAELRYARGPVETGQWIGVDLSNVAVDAARRRFKGHDLATFTASDIFESHPIIFRWASVVLFTEVLEHVKDDVALLLRVPSPKFVVFTVPDHDSEGHVRWFRSDDAVYERYGLLFHDLKVTPLVVGERTYYIGRGLRAPTTENRP